ncbi:HIT family hydrolase, partial [Peptococcaceae bacterium SCADC1_2_3]
QGDTNFMTTINNTRVMSEGLKATYRKLKETIKNM